MYKIKPLGDWCVHEITAFTIISVGGFTSATSSQNTHVHLKSCGSLRHAALPSASKGSKISALGGTVPQQGHGGRGIGNEPCRRSASSHERPPLTDTSTRSIARPPPTRAYPLMVTCRLLAHVRPPPPTANFSTDRQTDRQTDS
jgi:hypothetical protein